LPYTYLVDVLQRISLQPARDVEELTPRRWKPLFADKPLRSLKTPNCFSGGLIV
jgi:transposase